MTVSETTVTQIPNWKQPSHPGLVEVKQTANLESFASWAAAAKNYSEGDVIAKITTATPATAISYSSVQVGEVDHIELNSDLVYCNHSCDPNIIFDVNPGKMILKATRDIKKGEALTFFYPSTEWDMAQGFDCYCGSGKCLGRIDGAGKLDPVVLNKFWLSDHIKRLLEKQAKV